MKKVFRKVLAVLLTVIMLISIVPFSEIDGFIEAFDFSFSAKAEDSSFATSGQCGENIFWTLDSETGLLTISGEGEMGNYVGTDSPFYSIREEIKNIVIDNGVTSLGNHAFAYCQHLKGISFPENSLKSIGEWTFYLCNHLANITIPESVLRIGEYAFSYCQALKEIELPNSMDVINTGVFSNCTSLKNVSIPDSITSINSYAFGSCKELTDITIPDSVIYLSGFNECEKLTEISIPDSVSKIGDYAFRNCRALTNIIIPDGVSSIGRQAFFNCIGLTEIKIPNSVTIIGAEAFLNCTGLNKMFIPDSVVTLGAGAFDGCSNLKEIIISDSLVTIYKSSNKEVYFSDIYFTGTEEQWNSISNADQLLNDDTVVHYNYGKETGVCGENLTWSYNTLSGKLVVDGTGPMDNCDSINDYGWYSFKEDISYVEISDTVTSVGTNSFSGCSALKEIRIGKGTEIIGANAFADCTELAIVSVTGEKFDADNAFSNNSSNLTFVIRDTNKDAVSFTESRGIPTITVSYSADDILSFGGKTVVYSGLDYNFLTDYINEHSSAEYIHFEKLVFDGVKSQSLGIFELNLYEEIDTQTEDFTLNNLFVSLKVICGDNERSITFGEILELLSNGNYDAFKLTMISKEQYEEATFFEKVRDFFVGFVEDALRLMSKAVNFIVSIFKKK